MAESVLLEIPQALQTQLPGAVASYDPFANLPEITLTVRKRHDDKAHMAYGKTSCVHFVDQTVGALHLAHILLLRSCIVAGGHVGCRSVDRTGQGVAQLAGAGIVGQAGHCIEAAHELYKPAVGNLRRIFDNTVAAPDHIADLQRVAVKCVAADRGDRVQQLRSFVFRSICGNTAFFPDQKRNVGVFFAP